MNESSSCQPLLLKQTQSGTGLMRCLGIPAIERGCLSMFVGKRRVRQIIFRGNERSSSEHQRAGATVSTL